MQTMDVQPDTVFVPAQDFEARADFVGKIEGPPLYHEDLSSSRIYRVNVSLSRRISTGNRKGKVLWRQHV